MLFELSFSDVLMYNEAPSLVYLTFSLGFIQESLDLHENDEIPGVYFVSLACVYLQ